MSQEIEEEKVELAQQLLRLSTNVLKVRTMIYASCSVAPFSCNLSNAMKTKSVVC